MNTEHNPVPLILAIAAAFCCPALPAVGGAPDESDRAAAVFEKSGVSGGLIVHLNCGDGTLTAALRKTDRCLVHGLDPDAGNIAAARKHIRSRGIYGPVAAMRWDRPFLPYRDNLVDLIVAEDAGQIDEKEMTRVLAPLGVALVNDGSGWKKTVKPRPDDIGDWSHWLADAGNDGVADDTRVGPPHHLQWKCGPLWARSHDRCPPSTFLMLSAKGRLFTIYDEGTIGLPRMPARWTLIARDAFNGVLLWKRPARHRDRWTIAAGGDFLYLTDGKNTPLTILDAATGAVRHTCPETGSPARVMYAGGTVITYDPGKKTLVAVDPATGTVRWKKEVGAIPGKGREALAAAGGRLCFAAGTQLVCLGMTDGSELWRSTAGAKRVIMTGNIVLAGNTVYAAKDGKKRCRVKGNLVAAGLVWSKVGMTSHSHQFHWAPREATATGYDPLTGEKKKVVTVPRLVTPGHHFRCYPPKATDRYLLLNKRGVEFFDLQGDNHMRHDWLRAPCKHGALPANGLLYMSTSPCFCYPGVKLSGFNALSETIDDGGHRAGEPEKRLHRGPAYGTAAGNPCGKDDWPTYRHDALRSGAAGTAVPADLGLLWEAKLQRRLTPPVAAGGRVFCAAADRHAVVCLDADNGEILWRFIAGARVDSPPTVCGDLVVFGSTDGRVYCLRAADGETVWTFDAAPRDRLVTIFGQLESAWPVHGSVLHQNGKLYLSAGRSSYLDGGMYYYALDPDTGEVLHDARVASRRPDISKDPGLPYDMEGTRTDVLVGDGEDCYQFFVRFTPDLTRKETPRITKLGDRRVSRHLMSNAGLLDRTWFDRNFWIHGTRWPGFYFAYDAPKSGQILVFDDDTTYGLHVYRHRSGHSPIFEPGSGQYELFADESAGRAVLRPMEMGREKGTSLTRMLMPKWSVEIPVRALAMVLAGDRLCLAGPPDEVPRDDPTAALEGRRGSRLWVVAAETGEKRRDYALSGLPAFDGMIAAAGRLYLSMEDGRLLCIGDAKEGTPLKKVSAAAVSDTRERDTKPAKRKRDTAPRKNVTDPFASLDGDRHEAEDARLSGCAINDNNPGFTGKGFVNFSRADGASITWTITAPESGRCELVFHYALGSGTRPLKLTVDGKTIDAAMSLPPTGSFQAWSTAPPAAVTIEKGTHELRVETTGKEGPNIDCILVRQANTGAGT